MFLNSYQNSPTVEIYDSRVTTDHNPQYKNLVKCAKAAIYIKEFKNYVLDLTGESSMNGCRLTLPANDRKQTLGLTQRYLILQIWLPGGVPWAIELIISDIQGTKRRINVNSLSTKEESKYFSIRTILPKVEREIWTFLGFDLWSFMDIPAFRGFTYRSLDGLTIFPVCKLRRIFTMKNYFDADIPRQYHFPPQIAQKWQLVDYQAICQAQSYQGGFQAQSQSLLEESKLCHLESKFSNLHGKLPLLANDSRTPNLQSPPKPSNKSSISRLLLHQVSIGLPEPMENLFPNSPNREVKSKNTNYPQEEGFKNRSIFKPESNLIDNLRDPTAKRRNNLAAGSKDVASSLKFQHKQKKHPNTNAHKVVQGYAENAQKRAQEDVGKPLESHQISVERQKNREKTARIGQVLFSEEQNQDKRGHRQKKSPILDRVFIEDGGTNSETREGISLALAEKNQIETGLHQLIETGMHQHIETVHQQIEIGGHQEIETGSHQANSRRFLDMQKRQHTEASNPVGTAQGNQKKRADLGSNRIEDQGYKNMAETQMEGSRESKKMEMHQVGGLSHEESKFRQRFPTSSIITQGSDKLPSIQERSPQELELVYDEMVGCYYHPKTNTYYELNY